MATGEIILHLWLQVRLRHVRGRQVNMFCSWNKYSWLQVRPHFTHVTHVTQAGTDVRSHVTHGYRHVSY